MPIRTKRIYDTAEPEDGYRLLIMRLWPRGIRKERVSEWQPELGPSRPLLKAFQSGAVDWEGYTRVYVGEMATKRELLDAVRARTSAGTVTLLCSCRDENRCHRRLLKGLLEGSLHFPSQS